MGQPQHHHPAPGHLEGLYGKRSADAKPEAEADPYLLYGGYSLGYSYGLGYGHGCGYGLGYGGYYYGKEGENH